MPLAPFCEQTDRSTALYVPVYSYLYSSYLVGTGWVAVCTCAADVDCRPSGLAVRFPLRPFAALAVGSLCASVPSGVGLPLCLSTGILE